MNAVRRSEAGRLFARSCHDARHRKGHLLQTEHQRHPCAHGYGRCCLPEDQAGHADPHYRDRALDYCPGRNVPDGNDAYGCGRDGQPWQDDRDHVTYDLGCRCRQLDVKPLTIKSESVLGRPLLNMADSRIDDAPGGVPMR